MPPTPRSAATQAPPLVSEHGRGGGYKAPPKPKKKTVAVKAHVRQILVPDLNPSRAGAADSVSQQVDAAQLPQLQAIQRAQAASELAAKNQATTTQGYYAALADTLKSIGPATQAGYSSAAANDSAFGKGFSDGLAHVQSQTQQEGANLAGISGGTAPPPVSPAASDALYATGGYIPATTMSREGAAFGAAANMLPATAAGQGADEIGRIGAQQRLDQKGFTNQYADLAAQAPGLRLGFQKEADAAAAEAAHQRQLAQTAAQHAADVKVQRRLQYIAATGIDPKTGKLTPKAQAEWARVSGYMPDGTPTASTVAKQTAGRQAQSRIDQATRAYQLSVDKYNAGVADDEHKATLPNAALSKAAGYFVDATGNPILNQNGTLHVLPGFKINAAGQVVKTSTAKGKSKTGGLSQKQINTYKGQAATIAAGAFTGLPEEKDRYGATVHKAQPKLDYFEALHQMKMAGIPLGLAIPALNEIYPEGQRGRPWNTPAVVNPGGPQGTDPGSKPPRRR